MGRKNNSAWTNAKCRGNRAQGRSDRANTIRAIREGGVWGTPFKHYPLDPIGVVESFRAGVLNSDTGIKYTHFPMIPVPCKGDIERDRKLTNMASESPDHYSPEWTPNTDRAERIKQACEIIDYLRLTAIAFTIANNGGSDAGRTEAQWSASSITFKNGKGTHVSILYDPERVLDPRDMVHELWAKVNRHGKTMFEKGYESFLAGKTWGVNGWKGVLGSKVYGWFREDRALRKIRKVANTSRGAMIQATNMADSPTLSRGTDWEPDDMLRVLSAREAIGFLDGFIGTLKTLADSAIDPYTSIHAKREYRIATLLREGVYTHEDIARQCHTTGDVVANMLGRFRLAISSDADIRSKALSASFGDVRYTLRDGMAGDYWEGYERAKEVDSKIDQAKKNKTIAPITSSGIRSYDKPMLVDRSRKSAVVFG